MIAIAMLLMGAAGAASQTDPSGDWRTWHSEHFRVHAKAHDSLFAVQAGREAERAYELLALELVQPDVPIELVLQDNLDFSNGFANTFPVNQINIQMPAPAGNPGIGYYDDWFRLVITHELAHVFHLDQAAAGWGLLRKVFGRAPFLFPNAYYPSWVSEGIAVYYESRFTEAGRLKGHYQDQAVQASAKSNKWVRSMDASFISPEWPAGLRPYAWGSRFFAFEEKMATDSAAPRGPAPRDSLIPRFIRRTSRQLWPAYASGPLRDAGGVSLDPGWAAMRDSFALRAGPPAGSIVERGLRFQPRPELSDDRRRVVYQRNDGRDNPWLVVVEVESNERLGRRTMNAAVEFDWVRGEVVVAQLDNVSPVDIRRDLYSWSVGGSWVRMTRGAQLGWPFPLPNGRVGAVFIGAAFQHLVSVGPDGAMEPLPSPAGVGWSGIELSPDSSRLVASRNHGGRWDIVVWDVDRPERLRSITADEAYDTSPSWGADGSTVFFTSEREGLPQIYAADLDDGSIVRVTDEPSGARQASILADGATLLYTTMLADGIAIVTAPLEHQPAGAIPGPGAPPSLAPAPQISPRQGGYYPWGALVPRYWVPFLRGENETGTFVGVSTGASGPIGRTTYRASLAVSPERWRWEASFGMSYSRWKRVRVDFGARQRWDLNTRILSGLGTVVPISERGRLLRAGATWRWRRWRSSIDVRLGGEISQETLFNDGDAPLDFQLPDEWLAGPVFSAVAGRAFRPAMAISPENGFRISGFFLPRWGLDGEGWSTEVQGDVSGFLALSLPGFSHWVLAGRVTAGSSGGPLAPRFSVGGVSSDVVALIPGVAVGSGRNSFSLRGYPRQGRFTRAVTSTAELRVPLIAVARGIWKIPLGLDRVSFTAFGETGGGWNNGDQAVPTNLVDVGGELVLDLALLYDLSLRARIGVAVPLTADGFGTEPGDANLYLAFGPSF